MSLLPELSDEQQKSLNGPTYPVNNNEKMLLLLLDSLLIYL
jgi:hypothetical protein